MKKLIWKLRFALNIRKKTDIPMRWAWDMAGANLEITNGDTSECPIHAVDEEISVWEQYEDFI